MSTSTPPIDILDPARFAPTERPTFVNRVASSSHPAIRQPILEFRSVTKRYDSVVALDQICLQIGRGEFFGLLGPNGAGKTTFMSIVAGLFTPDSGAVLLDGQPIKAGSGIIGFVPQHIALYATLTAEANLRIFGRLYGLRGAELRSRIDEVLEAVKLSDRRHDRVAHFSGGMQRRLNLAASLLHRPKLLLCDEPTVGVDPQSRNAVFELLEERNRAGLTIIYSTHYMEEASRLCERIGIIDGGKILALGNQHTLIEQLPFEAEIEFPAGPDVEAFAQKLQPFGRVVLADETYRFLPGPGYRLSEFYALSEAEGLSPNIFTHRRATLEALFLQLTGRGLRE